MTRDKFISFIDGKINTTAVLSIVEQKAAELDYTTENNQLGRWYASCYKMLKEASWSLVNFKLRVAENALTRQYVLLTAQFEDTLMSEVQPLRKSVWEKVDAFIKDNGNLGIDPEDFRCGHTDQ